MSHPFLNLKFPGWIEEYLAHAGPELFTMEERMDFVIGLSRINIQQQTGGPFAAAIFRRDNGSLIAPGVNLVLSERCSVLHAEIVAIVAAQKKLGTYDLSSPELPSLELISSTEPCAMCLGAVAWSGIRHLVCGARGSDAEETGFDEGEKPSAWIEGLDRRGVSVVRDVCRDKAAAVLREYSARGGVIYNPFYSKRATGRAKI